jgi:hypothetical protein
MGKLTHTVLTTSEAAAPRGRILRLQARITVENLVTAGFVAFAVATSVGYQLARWRAGGSGRP